MNILLLTSHLNFGGISAYTTSLARGLKKLGDNVIVASSGGDLLKLLEEEKIEHYRIPLNIKSELSPKIWVSLVRLNRLIRRKKIDVIHAQTRVAQVTAYFLSKISGISFIATCHGFFGKNLGRRIFPCWGEATIAISEAVREHLVNDFNVEKKKIYLIYNGVDVEKFKKDKTKQDIEGFRRESQVREDEKIVGIIGRLSSVKGHKFFLMAARQIVQLHEEVKFIIIGEGPEEEYLHQLVEKLKLEEKVIFLKPVFDTTFALKSFDVFVMPSLQEGLGLSILEAMASALPVVASNVGGIYSLIKDGVNGFLIPPKEPSAIAAAVYKLLKKPDLARNMGIEGQKIAQKFFSLDAMVNQTKNLYEKVVDAKKPKLQQ